MDQIQKEISMKNILLFIDSLGGGGAQRQLVGLAVLLQKNGYKVKVCTYHNLDFYKQFLDENQVTNELIPHAGNTIKRVITVWRYFRKNKPDWVISYQETPSLVACLAKVLGGKFRLMVSERNTTQKIGRNDRIRFFLYHIADAIVPNSHTQARFLLGHYPWMQKRMVTIINFVDLNRFKYIEKKKRKKPLIMVAASIVPHKNTLGLIHAAKLLKDRGSIFEIRWYGIVDAYVDYLNECRDLISQYGLDDDFQLLPKTKQIQEKYNECDFFCLPSFYEGTPNAICEAMSCGCPVLCSDVCDNSIYVQNDENGFLFNPRDPKNMADMIEKALTLSMDRYTKFCILSRKKVEEKLSDAIFIEKYMKIIEA